MFLLGPGFHAKMDACLADLADLPHGNLTAYNRTRAKADANYTGMAKPQSQVPQGVIQYEDVPAEIQLSFRSLQLVKGSSHAACAPTRVELAAYGGFRAMLNPMFDLPRLGTNASGGYTDPVAGRHRAESLVLNNDTVLAKMTRYWVVVWLDSSIGIFSRTTRVFSPWCYFLAAAFAVFSLFAFFPP